MPFSRRVYGDRLKDQGVLDISTPLNDRNFPFRSLTGDLPMAARIDAQREQLFQGMAIVECCKYASASRLEIRDPEYIATVFDAVYDLLDKIAGQLGEIADELPQTTTHSELCR